MDISALHSLVTSKLRGGKLIIANDTLKSKSVISLFKQYGFEEITCFSCKLHSISNNNFLINCERVSISAKKKKFELEQSIEIRFYTMDGEPQFVLSQKLSKRWDIGKAFNNEVLIITSRYRINYSTLFLSTAAAHVSDGLFFYPGFSLLGKFDSKNSISRHHALVGIRSFGDKNQVTFKTDILHKSAKALGFCFSDIHALGCESINYGNIREGAFYGLSGNIQVGNDSDKARFLISESSLLYSDFVNIEIDFHPGISLSKLLSEAKHIFTNAGLLDSLPSNFSAFKNDLKVLSLGVDLDIKKKALNSVQVDAVVKLNQFRLFEHLNITISSLHFKWVVNHPLSREVSLSFVASAELTLFDKYGAQLKIDYHSKSNHRLVISLQKHISGDTNTLLGHFNIPTGLGLTPPLDLYHFNYCCDYVKNNSNYELGVWLKGKWKPFSSLNVYLDQLFVEINYDASNHTPPYSAIGAAQFELSDQVMVDLRFEKHSVGWGFCGELNAWHRFSEGKEKKPISVAKLIKDLGKHGFPNEKLPAFLDHIDIKNILVEFDTNPEKFKFHIEGIIELSEKSQNGLFFNLTVDFQKHRANGVGASYKRELSGYADVYGHHFQIDFESSGNGKRSDKKLKAEWSEKSAGAGKKPKKQMKQKSLSLNDLIYALGMHDSDVPSELDVDLSKVTFEFEKKVSRKNKTATRVLALELTSPHFGEAAIVSYSETDKKKSPQKHKHIYLLALEPKTSDLDFKNFPVVGKGIGAMGGKSGVEQVKLNYASAEVSEDDATVMNNHLKELSKGKAIQIDSKGLNKGISFALVLTFADEKFPVHSAKKSSKASAQLKGSKKQITVIEQVDYQSDDQQLIVSPLNTETPDKPKTVSSGISNWIKVQKKFGSFYLAKIGLGYNAGKLDIALDAVLSVGGLSIALDGLGIETPLDKFAPHFSLAGLGVEFHRGNIDIEGMFLQYNETTYAGEALVKYGDTGLSVIGAYSSINGHTAMFVFGVLDAHLGGPIFFDVTGLAAGFGYNEALKIPKLDQVNEFPLVKEATVDTSGRGHSIAGVQKRLDSLKDWIHPEVGQDFLAAGVKFESFKQIDSFALVITKFGTHFSLDLLGLSQMVVPSEKAKGVTELANVQLQIKAGYHPDDGVLSVRGLLSDASFLLTRQCHLSGGFAFESWFDGKDAGDFVCTLGGYHPAFKRGHYPAVPRLEFRWQVSNDLSIKGATYFALTSHALMAGGNLELKYHSGHIRAWLVVGANFLLAWQPFYYDVKIYVSVGGSYTYNFFGTHTLSIHVGADLALHGPDFAGVAKVDLGIIAFSIAFGATTEKPPATIPWDKYRKAFFPQDSQQWLTSSLKGGLLASSKIKPKKKSEVFLGVVNAKDLKVHLESKIPIHELNGTKIRSARLYPNHVKNATSFGSQFTFTIESGGGEFVDKEFKAIHITKNAPTSMWTHTPEKEVAVNSGSGLEEGVFGVSLTAKNPPKAIRSHEIKRSNLSYEQENKLLPKRPTAQRINLKELDAGKVADMFGKNKGKYKKVVDINGGRLKKLAGVSVNKDLLAKDLTHVNLCTVTQS
ncbi:MAG: hypothetical protein GKR95_24295 [Gammaproteobacteria bacterium]|nr:hypothetical protein [Gammaproteobacteria bacterium]